MARCTKDKAQAFTPSRVGQVGMVVRNARRSAEHFSRLYNIRPWYLAQFTHKETFYRGRPIDLDAEILMGFCGGVEIELIQMNNDVENIYSDILKKQDGGIHHVGFFISRYDEKVAEAQARGAKPLQWGTLKTKGGAVTRYMYFDTIETCGTVTEYIETKFLGLCIPHLPFMVRFSGLTGDVRRLDL
jgi:hypothetical protein